MSQPTWQALTGASLLIATLLTVGCAQDVGDINRVQPNAIEKETFLQNNEWYYRQTIVDSDWQGSIIFEGYQSALKRVKWVVTEDVLYACSTTPPVQGGFIQEGFQDNECFGTVAAFPIMGHFDIQRAYNTATGEQSNLLVENYSDRPWFERDYFRVNWSRNLIDGMQMFHSLLGRFSANAWSVPFEDNYVDPDRARIKPDEGYMELTTGFFFEPDINACYQQFTYDGIFNCEGGLLRVSHSFARVPDEKTYEPLLHLDNEYMRRDDEATGPFLETANIFDPGSGYVLDVECNQQTRDYLLRQDGEFANSRCQRATVDYFSRFGYFRTENVRFDADRGATDLDREYLANAHNIWQTAYDADGKLLPMSQRKPKPVVYYLNDAYPQDMIGGAREVERQWNLAFLDAVRLAKGYSTITEVEDELEELYGDRRMYKILDNRCMPNQVVAWSVLHGKVQDADRSDPRAIIQSYVSRGSGADDEASLWSIPVRERVNLCAELEYATERRSDKNARFDWERAADLRKSFFYWVDEFNSGWLGYGPSSPDPMTGEIISGTAHMAGTTMRQYAVYAADLVQYMNGELTDNQIMYGDQVRQHLDQVRERAAETMSQTLSPAGKREMAVRGGDVPSRVSPTGFAGKMPSMDELPRDFMRQLNKHNGVKGMEQAATVASMAARAAKSQDTRFLEFMDRSDVKPIMLADPQAMLTIRAFAAANRVGSGLPFDPMDPGFSADELDLAYREFVAPNIIHERRERQNAFMARQNIFSVDNANRAAENLITYKGVSDFFKGKPRAEIERYFLDQMFVGTQLHEVGHTVGLRHNFNASLDAINYHDTYWLLEKAVLEGKITREQASTLDDPQLIAEIDPARAGAPYLNEAEFRLASVMDYTMDLTGRFAGLGKYDHAAINFVYGRHIQRWKDDIKLPNGMDTQLFIGDYTEMPLIFSGMPASADPNARRLAGINNILNGREWVSIDRMRQELVEGIKSNTTKFHNREFTPTAEPFQQRVIPFNFCSDEYNGQQLGCTVFDWGSNQREIVNHSFNTFRYMQTFWRNRRQSIAKLNENVNTYVNRLFQTFDMAERPFFFYAIYKIFDLGLFTDNLREAAIDAANFYVEVMAMPQPGVNCLLGPTVEDARINDLSFFDATNTYVPADFHYNQAQCPDPIVVQPGDGQYFGYDLTDEYYFRIDYVGTFIDKLIALNGMFNVSSNFLFSPFITDARASQITYWTLFPNEMKDMLRGLILNDYSKFGGLYNQETQSYEPPMMVDRELFGRGLGHAQDGKPRIFTQLTFNHEFNAMVLAMITNTNFYDRQTDFAQYIKVAVDATEVQDWGNAQVVEFYHPVTNQRYFAPQAEDGGSISVDMIVWANRVKTRWTQAQTELTRVQGVYDQLRADYGSSYNPRLCLDEMAMAQDPALLDVCDAMTVYETTRASRDNLREQMEDVVAKLDQTRFIFKALGPSALR